MMANNGGGFRREVEDFLKKYSFHDNKHFEGKKTKNEALVYKYVQDGSNPPRMK